MTVFYSDGSNKKNPGLGGYAYFSPVLNIMNGFNTSYPTIITCMEIKAIIEILNKIISLPNKNISCLIILTDCKIILDILNFESYPKHQLIKDYIDTIFNKCCYLIKNKKIEHIIMKKIKAHSIYVGNNVVDAIAKSAAFDAQYNIKHFKKTPYLASKSQWYDILNQKYRKKWNKDKIDHYNRHKKVKLMYRYIPKHTNKLYKCFRKICINPTGYIIMKLITDHNPLNYYTYHLFKKKNNKTNNNNDNETHELKQNEEKEEEKNMILYTNNINNSNNSTKFTETPLCETCQTPETTEHFILFCKKYDIERYQLKQNLKKIEYNNHITILFDLYHLIFGFNCFNNAITILIWEEIAKFVENTKRFKIIKDKPLNSTNINIQNENENA